MINFEILLKGYKKRLENDLSKLNEDLVSTNQIIITTEKCLELIKHCLKDTILRKEYIENVLSESLTRAFKRKYIFRLTIDEDSSTQVMKGLVCELSRNGEPFRSLKSFGRSVRDITNFIWSILTLILNGQTTLLLVCDEPFSHISSDMQKEIKAYIEELVLDLGIKILMITHLSEPFGTVYNLEKTINSLGVIEAKISKC